MGTGVLYGKAELLDAMPPWQGGGKMLTQVDHPPSLSPRRRAPA
jgi:selenocysteine lyase/cysteine desulfurase